MDFLFPFNESYVHFFICSVSETEILYLATYFKCIQFSFIVNIGFKIEFVFVLTVF